MHLPLIYSAMLSGYWTENCFMSLQKVLGQLQLDGVTHRVMQYYKQHLRLKKA